MHPCMQSLTSHQQSIFLKGRNITDGIILLKECVTYMTTNKKKGVPLKNCLNKAYDRLEWNFL